MPQGTSKEQFDQGGLGPGGVFSVSNTVGQTSTFNPSRIADCSGKLQALVINPGPRHRSEWIRIRLHHDIEVNPGQKKGYECTVCGRRINERKEWSVKCNQCKKWIHWDCTSLGEERRWSKQFMGTCCHGTRPSATQNALSVRSTSPMEGTHTELTGATAKMHEISLSARSTSPMGGQTDQAESNVRRKTEGQRADEKERAKGLRPEKKGTRNGSSEPSQRGEGI